MLKLSDIRKPLKIDVQSPCVITRLGRIENRYDIDWDIILSDENHYKEIFVGRMNKNLN